MQERIESLRRRVMTFPRKVSLERARLYKESFETTEGQPFCIRRARAFANTITRFDIVIHPDELIVGGRTAEPRAGVVSPELGAEWLMDELDTISTRAQDAFLITDEQKRIYREVLFPFFQGKDMRACLDASLSDNLRGLRDARVFRINQTDKGQGHILPDYAILLQKGIGAAIAELSQRAESSPDNAFFKSALICHKAFQHLIDRYAKLASDLASGLASDPEGQASNPDRQAELERIAENLRAIREKPPVTFHQALQLFWLACVALQIESNASSISIGRFDQFMLPFFKQDIEQDRLSFDEAYQLLSCLWIKMNEVVMIRSEDSARYFGGFPTGYNMVLGGVTPDGWDGTNQLSYLCLEVTSALRLPQPNLSVRVHQSTPTSFLRKSSELAAQGFGLPQIFNDDSVVETLVHKGVSRADAKNYGIVGCVQLSIPGKMYSMPDVALFNLLKCLELVIHNGLDPVTGLRFPVAMVGDYAHDFADFERSVMSTVRLYVSWACEAANLVDLAHRKFAPVPFLSTLMTGCVESGRDLTEGGTVYNFTGLQQIGIANLADAMLVVRKAVYEQHILSLDELSRILMTNYEGHEDIRRLFIGHYAKYGNNIEEVDTLASRYLSLFCGYVSENANPRGGRFSPGSYTVSAHIPMGATVGATPDGRKSGMKLADGGLAPSSGLDRLGPVSLLRTVSRLDSELLSNGSLLNLRFSPASFSQKDSFDRYFRLIKLFIKLKLLHVQFSVVDEALLLDAQQHPDQYPDLLVRVAGYSAYFKDLGREVQDDLIDRCKHNMELTADE